MKSLAHSILPVAGWGRNRINHNEAKVKEEFVGGDRADCGLNSQFPSRSIQIVLICGGRGTRLGALNPERKPKAMFPIHGEPLVSHLWRRYRALTSTSPIVIHSASDTSIPEWAKTLDEGAILCPQATPDGVANAFALAAPHLTGSALFLLGDVVLHGGFTDPWPAPPAVGIWPEGSEATLRANFGVRLNGDRIAELVEKPVTGSGLVCGIGAYLLTVDHVREFLNTPRNPRTGEREITEALRWLVQHGHELRTLRFSGTYLNVNEPSDVIDASRLL